MRWALLLLLAVPSAGCSSPEGVVEWAWSFVDQNGDAVFPSGVFDVSRNDACALPGRMGITQVNYDLGTELTICDPMCPGGCDDVDCQVVRPLEFGCTNSRGSNPTIPADDAAYQFRLEPVITLPDGEQCRDLDLCIAAPGPRERVVEGGLVTDLQVFQLVLSMDQDGPRSASGALDLEACRCG